ncbi:MAG TPA: glycerophosphodiester phosphodiesterase [Patescibacteria group bacterium]|nr:glycerophosphodiester phosphodiesterase [Patescibacteria group bacterium]
MLRIAHRGSSALHSENTLKAFSHAINSKPDMIEVDVRVTKDGAVVAMHDKTLKRTTNKDGKVRDITLSHLQKLQTREGEPIPTLQEVLDLAKGKTKINIDLKEIHAVKPTIALIEKQIKESKFSYSDFLLSAFSIRILWRVKLLQPKLSFAFNFIALPDLFLLLSILLRAKFVKPHKRLLTKTLLRIAHRYQMKVIVWTVNDKAEIERFEKMGVDGIISDYPDRI